MLDALFEELKRLCEQQSSIKESLIIKSEDSLRKRTSTLFCKTESGIYIQIIVSDSNPPGLLFKLE